MEKGRRETLARLGAPAAFLAAVTVAVVLVRAGLTGDGGTPSPATTVPTQTLRTAETAPTVPRVTTAPPVTTALEGDVYVIKPGDTLAAVAARFGTTVEQLLLLNPTADPVALRIGERIRVK